MLITTHTSKIQHARIQSTGYSLLYEEDLKSKGIYQAQSFLNGGGGAEIP